MRSASVSARDAAERMQPWRCAVCAVAVACKGDDCHCTRAVASAQATSDDLREQVAHCVERARGCSSALVSQVVFGRLALRERDRSDAQRGARTWRGLRDGWMAAARTLRAGGAS